VANRNNTNVVLDKDAFTLSEPKSSFAGWFRQKARHYSTSRFYRFKHRFLLGLYSFSHFAFYPLFVAALFVFDWRIVVAVFLLRALVQAFIFYKAMQRLNEKDLFTWWWLLDVWMLFYYVIFAPALWKKPKKSWN
jgi:hypothetical protein